MHIPPALLAAFPPSADQLLECVRRGMDDEMLWDVARADYGYQSREMFEELRPIRDHGNLPSPMSGQLSEVLALTCWSDPDRPNQPPFEPGPTGERGHQTRLFACVVLLRAAAEPACQYADPNSEATLAQGLASARDLGQEINEALSRFLIWKSSRVEPWETGWFALGLLVVMTRLSPTRRPSALLEIAADWILALEGGEQNESPYDPANPEPAAFGVQQGFWRPLGQELESFAASLPDDDLRTRLQLCALLTSSG